MTNDDVKSALEEYDRLINGTKLYPVITLCFEGAQQLAISRESSEIIINAAKAYQGVEVVTVEGLQDLFRERLGPPADVLATSLNGLAYFIKEYCPNGLRIKEEE